MKLKRAKMSVKKIISDLSKLYKKILQRESTEDNSVDFLLQDLERQAEINRQKIADLGFWVEDEKI
jgi:acyl-[acyl carrier protein]--UDP-N-acetylglucosamine O-acyltransferase